MSISSTESSTFAISSCPLFKPVEVTADCVAIVASGPSFREADYSQLGHHVHIIAVKGAVHGLKRADSWITVDANRKVRRSYMDLSQRKRGVQYYAAVPEDFGKPHARLLWHRDPPEPDIHWLRRVPGIGLSEDSSIIHTGNSAYAALGLAYHMRARKVAFFGVDGTQEPYGIGPGRPRGSLVHLPTLFSSSISQLSQAGVLVKNAGRLPVFDRVNPEDAIAWLNDA